MISAIFDAPAFAWHWYWTNLWLTQPNSWVASVAWTFRLLAILLISPFVILTLLDLTSYVIGRTLGLGVHNASTSDKVSAIQRSTVPAIRVQEVNEEASGEATKEGGEKLKVEAYSEDSPHVGASMARRKPRLKIEGFTPLTTTSDAETADGPPSSPSPYFLSPTEEGNLELSGYDVFSPAVSRAASQPPSPTTGRRALGPKPSTIRSGASSSSSGESSFTVIDKDIATSTAGSLRRRDAVEASSDEQ